MFANVAGSYLWGWTAVGAALEILFQILPVALGLRTTIDAGLARVFFSWTLHAIVYFWLIPTYIAYYTIFPRAIGGRLYSDAMARISFILFVVVAMPIGVHHLFADPQVGAGFKFMHSVFTGLVALPTLLTVFTICASAEIASRLRGGRGAFGWLTALPWHNPIMLATALSLVMLGFGGAGGLINMSYQLDSTIHNTQWITGHFPPDLRRRHRDHVFRHRLRSVAASHRPGAGQFWPDAHPALAVVHRHDRDDLPVALCRHSRHAAPHGVLRLRRSGDRAAGVFGLDVGDRRADPSDVGRAVSHRPDPGPDGAATARRAPTGSPWPCMRRRRSRWR